MEICDETCAYKIAIARVVLLLCYHCSYEKKIRDKLVIILRISEENVLLYVLKMYWAVS